MAGTDPTPFELSSRYVDELVGMVPVLATSLGLPGHDHEWGAAFGLDGHEERMDLVRRYRTEFARHLDHPDSVERLAAQVMTGALDEAIAADEAGEQFYDLSHMASSFQRIRSVFDVMDTTRPGGWDDVCRRLETIDRPLSQYRQRLDEGRSRGFTVAARQVASVVAQARQLASDDSSFHQLAGQASDSPVAERVERAVGLAKAAVADFADHLERNVLPFASATDGVGEDRYRASADRLVGLAVDPLEAYRWGWDEFARRRAEMARVGAAIVPGGSVDEVRRVLEEDPERCAPTAQAFLSFIEKRLDDARVRLTGTHFDVDPRIEPLTVNLAPAGTPLGAYYLRPSEDFSRPGGVWYSVGDQATFPLYHHVSTAYHEGFPGHHLQNGTAMVNADRISRGQRTTVWYPGYGEGWAMYTERLMGEIGFLEESDYEFGMLAKHLYRAARVVVDIGLHLGLTIADTSPLWPGESWTFDRAVEFMRVYGFRTPAQAEGEVMRYLGWPGQAIAYKLGEREFLSIRADSERRLGSEFDLKAFHREAIGNGAMRLDLLREVMRERL